MPHPHRRILVVAALVLLAGGGAHLLVTQPLAVAPTVWPDGAATTPAAASAPPVVASATPSPAAARGADPLLSGALEQLNASTESTATGLWAILRELESGLAARLATLAHQLEPGR
ncbi:MAG: hypothetical protein ACYDAC_03625 [Candidatus Dormibacteria bacterium]